MSKYRIKECECYVHQEYIIQKKSILGFWYIPLFIDNYNDLSLESAQHALKKYTHKRKEEVVYEINTNN